MSKFKLEDRSIMPFGRHHGKRLDQVPASYLLWCLDQEWCAREWPPLIEYIKKNMKALELEVKEQESNNQDRG